MQRPIRRRHPVVVFVAPVAADLRPLLEAVEVDPARLQHLRRRDPRAPRPDDARLHGRKPIRPGPDGQAGQVIGWPCGGAVGGRRSPSGRPCGAGREPSAARPGALSGESPRLSRRAPLTRARRGRARGRVARSARGLVEAKLRAADGSPCMVRFEPRMTAVDPPRRRATWFLSGAMTSQHAPRKRDAVARRTHSALVAGVGGGRSHEALPQCADAHALGACSGRTARPAFGEGRPRTLPPSPGPRTTKGRPARAALRQLRLGGDDLFWRPRRRSTRSPGRAPRAPPRRRGRSPRPGPRRRRRRVPPRGRRPRAGRRRSAVRSPRPVRSPPCGSASARLPPGSACR